MNGFKQWLNEATVIDGREFRSPLVALKYIQQTHPNPENLVVTYTAINKVGINPKSQWATPLGIYFYPLDYVIKEKMQVPFAADQPYINVCELTRPHKILHMRNSYRQLGLHLLDNIPKAILDAAKKDMNRNIRLDTQRSNYSMLWLLTMQLSKQPSGNRHDTSLYPNITIWNQYLRRNAGIDGFIDHGTGTIHVSEPTQGVAFSSDALRRIHVIENNRWYRTSKFADNLPSDNYLNLTPSQLKNYISLNDNPEWTATAAKNIMIAAHQVKEGRKKVGKVYRGGKSPFDSYETAAKFIVLNTPTVTVQILQQIDLFLEDQYQFEFTMFLIDKRKDLSKEVLMRLVTFQNDEDEKDADIAILNEIFKKYNSLKGNDIADLFKLAKNKQYANDLIDTIFKKQENRNNPNLIIKLITAMYNSPNKPKGWEKKFFPLIDQIGVLSFKNEIKKIRKEEPPDVIERTKYWKGTISARTKHGWFFYDSDKGAWLNSNTNDFAFKNNAIDFVLSAYKNRSSDTNYFDDQRPKLDKYQYAQQSLPRVRGPKPQRVS